jgi:hypothetical protein
MILLNKKMRVYFDRSPIGSSNNLQDLAFIKVGQGFFFLREVNKNVMTVAEAYMTSKNADWAGLEYGTNKLHLEEEVQDSISEVTAMGVHLVQRLASQFKREFPDQPAVFWLGCDEFGEYPSVTLGFYIKREGMTPLLPEDETSLERFSNAILLVT